jgi:mono/diheme cytochrome c family protein
MLVDFVGSRLPAMNSNRLLSALFLVGALGTARSEEPLPATVEFNRDIRPIFSDVCYKCHGPDKAKRKADLRLDVEANAKAKHDDGFPILPGSPDDSELIHRITTTDADERMPPADEGRQLTPRQIALLSRWIEQGAKWEAHWSFIAPRRPELPRVRNAAWPRNPVDHFILARLEREGLAPSPEAERATLIRRVSLDLTGLPPTLAEVDAFLADTSSEAYERVIDRLLASPRFGERMASRWLDAARYADTSGYQSDGERSMWRWRDWVIDAFNRNLPFDRFTIEQLAGDLLPGATRDQRIATGFNRNHRGNAEGGIIPEEYAAEYVVDRVDTTATVWLGLTMGCARCHDHKYDAVAQREFYQVFAFFNNVPEKGRAIKIGNSPPVLTAPTAAQELALAKLDQELHPAETRMRELEPQIAAAQTAWYRKLPAHPLGWSHSAGLRARYGLDGDLACIAGPNPVARFENGDAVFEPGLDSRVASFDGLRFVNCGDVGDFGFFDKFTLAAWVQPRGAQSGSIVSRMVEQAADSAFASDSEGYCLHLKDGHVQVHLTKRWLDDALRVETEATLTPGLLHHVAAVYDGSRLASGIRIFIDGQPQKLRVLLDQLNQTFQTRQPLRIGAGGGPANHFHGAIGDVRVYGQALSEEEIGILATMEDVTELAPLPAQHLSAGQSAKLRACFLAEHAPAIMREAQEQVTRLREERAKLVESLPTVMVMEELPEPRQTFVLKRGEYDKRGDRVSPGVPASLPSLPPDAPHNRLGFAQWLVSPANPLTARVAVNQMWQMLFGTGLVKTTEDFGSQGEPPSHPELLDWLATEFMAEHDAETGAALTPWDQKRMLRTIVMSATYRQSSARTKVRSPAFRRPGDAVTGSDESQTKSSPAPAKAGNPNPYDRDPDNRLLSRGPRVRLSAEMIRDQALAVSGLLVGEIGGPSVKPYQPKGLWKELSGTDYEPDHGDKLWRRSLYTFWKRTSPQPTMTTFDAAGREMCSVRATRTSTPLQALALMNDVTFVEAARCLAQRIMREATAPDERVRLAFRLVLIRPPKPAELQILLADWQEHHARFRAEPAAAEALVSAGEAPRDTQLPVDELAAYTALAGLILNLDEAITKQ